jgi:hypothetical protein
MTRRQAQSVRTLSASASPCLASSPAVWLRCALAVLLWLPLSGLTAIPFPEKLLPEDTLAMVTAPDFIRLREILVKTPQAQLWNDPAMKPFRERLVSRFNDGFINPLERELAIKFDDYTGLLQGQLTLAVTQNGWQGQDDSSPAFLLLFDAKDKSGQLKSNLAELRKKWVAARKPIRTEKIRDLEFIVLPLSSNDLPQTIRKIFPRSSEVQELGNEPAARKAARQDEWVVGQAESVLLVGNSTKAVEKVVARLTGGPAPPLGELATYQANHLVMFRDSPLYGWVNMKALMDVFSKTQAQKKENPGAPNSLDISLGKAVGALGLTSLKTVAFNFQDSSEGAVIQLYIGVPEADRQGLFKILAGEAKDTTPPPFVPADAVKFRRWRLDGQKGWATLLQIANDISPQALSTINFLLDSAEIAAREKDPGFDIKKSLIGNLGDDMISFEKVPRGAMPAQLQSPPSLFLIGSANAEQLALGLKSLLVYLPDQQSQQEREFLGRKIYSVALPPVTLTGTTRTPGSTSRLTLSYAASRSYLAMSTDASILEEYLRSSGTQGKSLREIPGLTEATPKVIGPGSSLFGYENGLETTRASFEAWRKNPNAAPSSGGSITVNLLPSATELFGASQDFSAGIDFSLLPPFDAVSKYFYFSVYGWSATDDGFTFKWFAPVPPALRGTEASRPQPSR